MRVRTPAAAELRAAVAAEGVTVSSGPDAEILTVTGRTAEEVGSIAFASGIMLYELVPNRSTVEQVSMEMTKDAVEFRSHSNTGMAA